MARPTALAGRLAVHLGQQARVCQVDAAAIDEALRRPGPDGQDAADWSEDEALALHLDELEAAHEFVLLLAGRRVPDGAGAGGGTRGPAPADPMLDRRHDGQATGAFPQVSTYCHDIVTTQSTPLPRSRAVPGSAGVSEPLSASRESGRCQAPRGRGGSDLRTPCSWQLPNRTPGVRHPSGHRVATGPPSGDGRPDGSQTPIRPHPRAAVRCPRSGAGRRGCSARA